MAAAHQPYSAHYISVPIHRSPDEVYAFACNPENLPQWASGLSSSVQRSGDAWITDSPMGQVRIRFSEKNTLGVMDHEVTLPSGVTVYNPMRVQPNNSASEVVFTLYRLPTMSPAKFQEDANRVRQDLERLKALLEK